MERLTKAQAKTLAWFAKQAAPVHLFAADGPTLNMRRWAVRQGFVSTFTRPGGWIAYEITPAGRLALQDGDAKP